MTHRVTRERSLPLVACLSSLVAFFQFFDLSRLSSCQARFRDIFLIRLLVIIFTNGRNTNGNGGRGRAVDEAKQSWAVWLGTDEAVRWVYLIFGFCAIGLLMICSVFDQCDLLRRCGTAISHRWSAELWQSFKGDTGCPNSNGCLYGFEPAKIRRPSFLFHLLQIPFLLFFEPVMAAKVAGCLLRKLAIFSVYW